MTCIKTGADVFLREYDCWVHCDLYRFNDVYIANFTLEGFIYRPHEEPFDLHIYNIGEHLISKNVIVASVYDCGPFVGWRED